MSSPKAVRNLLKLERNQRLLGTDTLCLPSCNLQVKIELIKLRNGITFNINGQQENGQRQLGLDIHSVSGRGPPLP